MIDNKRASFIIDRMSEVSCYITLQGSIGAGKSSVLKAIKIYIENNNLSAIIDDSHINNGILGSLDNLRLSNSSVSDHYNISKDKHYFIIMDEPVEKWKEEIYSLRKCNENPEDGKKCSMLGLFYEDQSKNGFMFQIHAFTTRLQCIIDQLSLINIKGKGNRIHIIAERSLRTDKLFFYNLYLTNMITKVEWDVYNTFFTLICNEVIKKENIMVYIKTSPKKCFERIQKRDRKGEGGIIPDYLITLDERHDIMVDEFRSQSENKVFDLNFEDDKNEDDIYNETSELMSDILKYIDQMY